MTTTEEIWDVLALSATCGWQAAWWGSAKEQERVHALVHCELTLRVGSGNASILDIGCGFGDFAKLLLPPQWDYRGIDISGQAVAKARDHRITKADFLQADLQPADWVAAIGTFSTEVADPLAYLTKCLNKMQRLAKKGVIFVGVNAKRFTRWKWFGSIDAIGHWPLQVAELLGPKVKLDCIGIDPLFMAVGMKE